jgi:ectoine hydroxylase-related dioxygenase (phytanoyl-CoA dioxygenase family)
MEGLDFFDPSLEEQEKLFASSGQEVRTVVPTLARGDVTFHHSRTVHGSGPNLTSAPRRSMAIHLQPSENRWAEGRDASGAPAYHRNDDLVQTVDGHPDYATRASAPSCGRWTARAELRSSTNGTGRATDTWPGLCRAGVMRASPDLRCGRLPRVT